MTVSVEHKLPHVNAGDEPQFGVLVDDIRVRVLNCSATGCLLETNKRVAVGTVAALQLTLNGRTFGDVVKVVRCEDSKRSGRFYRVAVHLVSTLPASAESLRYVMRPSDHALTACISGQDSV